MSACLIVCALQRKEASNGVIGGDKFEEEGLGRRTESLMACMALLEEKMHLILQSQRLPNRSDFARMRADLEREFQAEMSAKLRVASEVQMQLDAARAEMRRKDDEIAMLNNRMLQMREQQNFGDMGVGIVDVHSLEAMKQQMMEDRAMLENIIRNERKQREEEFNDMDANVRARDERIRDLDMQLLEMHRRLGAKEDEAHAKAKQIEELTILVQQRTNGISSNSYSGGNDAALHRAYAELQQQHQQLQRENQALEQKLTAVSRAQGGMQASDLADADRMEAVARQMATAAQHMVDTASLGASASKILQTHISEVCLVFFIWLVFFLFGVFVCLDSAWFYSIFFPGGAACVRCILRFCVYVPKCRSQVPLQANA